MTFLALEEKAKAIAVKLEMDVSAVLSHMHKEVDHLLGLADADVNAAKAKLEQADAKVDTVVDAEVKKVEGQVAAEVAKV